MGHQNLTRNKSGGYTQRTGSFKNPLPISYNTSTFSPRGTDSVRRERETIYSPVSMKAIQKKTKKGCKKNSTSKKRYSVSSQSKNHEDFTMFMTRNKPLFKFNK